MQWQVLQILFCLQALSHRHNKRNHCKIPGLKHVQYDADSFSGMLMANETTFGKKAIPSSNFANAKVIVSLGADFLGTWLNPVELPVSMRKK